MAGINVNTSNSNGWLTRFNNGCIPRLYITAEVDTVAEFDQVTLRHWQAEGFDVTFLPFSQAGQAYRNQLKELGKNLHLGEYFAIVAYGDAATECLEVFRKQSPRLCALVAYYPSAIPDPTASFPISLRVVVHLAGEEVGVTKTTEVLGLQGKRRTRQKRIGSGKGTGGSLELAYPSYTYADVEPGFAEYDLDEYDKTAERLSWSRSLDVVRKGFRIEVDLEKIWEEHLDYEFKTKDVDKTMATMVARPYVNHIPTLTGGVGKKDLHRFYRDFFIPSSPPSLSMRLMSRTQGVDRIVDEMIIAFDHTQEIPWMLPDIPPTNKHVEVALVSIVCIRGGKLYHEHIYWDQASVLVQLGMIDPKVVPKEFEKMGVERLPVAGAESARKALDETAEPSNELLSDW
ncbi:dienelactone hydrolase-like protein [Aulographum hederae CBS 113979]|uniref:Dienelactone hydrolase-like protein n=1 Tax=Aulographum hederae CBS 113979 TaxID=1176131 RepID=A0A6G1H368_9PEZI|nr:dienelactone hydrolase-like protein [Aulographum hederae CBS 113979]